MSIEYRVYVKDDLDENECAAPKKTFEDHDLAHDYARRLSDWQNIMVYEIDTDDFDPERGRGILDKTFYRNRNPNQSHGLCIPSHSHESLSREHRHEPSRRQEHDYESTHDHHEHDHHEHDSHDHDHESHHSDSRRSDPVYVPNSRGGGLVSTIVRCLFLCLCFAVLCNTGAINSLISQGMQHEISDYTHTGADAVINRIDNTSVAMPNATSTIHPEANGEIFLGTDGHEITLKNSAYATDPTYENLVRFIKLETTNGIPYDPTKFNSQDGSELVHNAAEAAGIKAGWVVVYFKDNTSRVCNVFNTTDSGTVYIDCTRDEGQGTYDTRAQPTIGEAYTRHSLYDSAEDVGIEYKPLGIVNYRVVFW